MKQQLDDGILEPVFERPTGDLIHCIPYQFKDEAEMTHLQIVDDCSAKQSSAFP